ncbi:hypothetical protein BDZ91DRAFT_46916 [Kalaharituber pfeilii]|nr:hypothetical protein BDZ91DRAFT_46916 [Kalaharituber pfeilii]
MLQMNSLLRALLVLCFVLFAPSNALPTLEANFGGENGLERVKPTFCPSPGSCLSQPSQGSKLTIVVLGVGTQNYTCASPTAVPAPIGAMATLFDISQLVITNPTVLHNIPAMVMWAGLHDIQNAAQGNVPLGLGYPQVGTHIFTPDAKTPYFELKFRSNTLKLVGQKLEGFPAPSSAYPGSVNWLKLGRATDKEKESIGIKYVYRLFTAGGKPPATCEGLEKEFTVNYATEYWVYN